MPAQTCFDGQRVILPELHRCSPTNGLLGGNDDGVTLNLSRTCQSPNPSRVLCIFGNTQINLLGLVISSATSHTRECSSHFLPGTFELRESLKARLLFCWFVGQRVVSRSVAKSPTSRFCLSPLMPTNRIRVLFHDDFDFMTCCFGRVLLWYYGKAAGIILLWLAASASWLLEKFSPADLLTYRVSMY